MKHYDIIIIGFGPGGIVSAMMSRRLYDGKSVAIITKKQKYVVPCAIPYMNYTLDPEQNILPYEMVEKAGIKVIEDEIKEIIPNEKKLIGNEIYSYEKLIIATGSKPITLPIPGIEKKHIYPIYKNFDHLKWLNKDLEKAKNVVIIGASFAGLEFADELSNLNLNITVIDILPDVVYNAFDEFMREKIRESLKEKGVKFIFNSKVLAFEGDEYVKGVKLEKETIPADLVILATGVKPNSNLAKNAGIELNEFGFIKVNAFQETSVKDIFAIGDVAEKIDFFTLKPSKLMLATIACEEARIAALNLYTKVLSKELTLPVYSTIISGMAFANAGLTLTQAKRLGYDVIVGEINTYDKHPPTLPKSQIIKGKMLFTKDGTIIGVQMFGSKNIGEIINLAAYLIQKRAKIDDIINMKAATQPWLTAAPTSLPLVIGAFDAYAKMIKK